MDRTQTLETLAIKLANLNFAGLSREEVRDRLSDLLFGLDRADADQVVEHAKAIAREQAGRKLKEAAVLEAFGKRVEEIEQDPEPSRMERRALLIRVAQEAHRKDAATKMTAAYALDASRFLRRS